MATTNDHGVTAGESLLPQAHHDDALRVLSVAAKNEPKIPRRSSPDDVRKRLN